MKLGQFAVYAVLSLAVVGCGRTNGFKEESASAPDMTRSSAPADEQFVASGERASTPVSSGRPSAQRAVIRSAEVSVRVEKLSEAERQLKKVSSAVGGYIGGSSSENLSDRNPSSKFSLRVPSSRFDEVIEKIEALGTATSRKITTEDVTGQLVDLEARMRALRAQEQATLGLLGKAHSLQDTITVRDQLTRIRTEIEEMDGQRQSLSHLAAMSTIEVTLNQSLATTAKAEDPNWVTEAWGSSTTGAGKALREIAKLGISMVAYAPFWVPVVLVLWWLWRKLVQFGSQAPPHVQP